MFLPVCHVPPNDARPCAVDRACLDRTSHSGKSPDFFVHLSDFFAVTLPSSSTTHILFVILCFTLQSIATFPRPLENIRDLQKNVKTSQKSVVVL